MRQIFEKNMRILANLLSFCHTLGGKSFQIDLDPGLLTSHIVINAEIPDIDLTKLEEFREALQYPRRRELEHYWYLGGESELGSNLTLVAAMIDEVSVTYAEGILTVKVSRDES